MNINATPYPEFTGDWVFQSLGLNPGEETSTTILDALQTLNDMLLQRGDDDFNYSNDNVLAKAYTLYYMPVNMAKLWFVLDRCRDQHLSALDDDSICISEMGCGPGTFSFATLFWLCKQSPEHLERVTTVRGIDRSKIFLDHFRALADQLKTRPEFAHITFEAVQADWQTEISNDTDFLIFGNTLNETASPHLNELNANACLIIEPGTREIFHQLLPIRDALVENGWQLHFPCPTHEACPMQQDNWCHFSINRFQLPFIQRMSAMAGRDKHRHHFSAFYLNQTPSNDTSHWRVLSNTRKTGGSAIRYMCNGNTQKEYVLNRKEKSEANKPFIDAIAGDAITIESDRSAADIMASGRIKKSETVTRR